MKRASIKDLNELKSLRDQLKLRAEQEKKAEHERQVQAHAMQAEANIFRVKVGEVTPIKASDTYQHPRTPIPTKNTPEKSKEITSMAVAMMEIEQWSDEFDASQWHSDKENQEHHLSYVINGSNPDLLMKLRKGQWPVQAYLDLHGMRGEEARTALADFLRRSRQARLRSVCVIHGKGIHSRQTAVLPGKVRAWLSQSELVQAFCPAQPAEGGDGALHVLLIATK
ncbi:MAG: mismatch repair protein MutS [Solimicrobium sp.]|jgi:DNA-nicking Smr family endonuclease|nr:mismatch repair protein MutS [Solimicrobium sp.]